MCRRDCLSLVSCRSSPLPRSWRGVVLAPYGCDRAASDIPFGKIRMVLPDPRRCCSVVRGSFQISCVDGTQPLPGEVVLGTFPGVIFSARAASPTFLAFLDKHQTASTVIEAAGILFVAATWDIFVSLASFVHGQSPWLETISDSLLYTDIIRRRSRWVKPIVENFIRFLFSDRSIVFRHHLVTMGDRDSAPLFSLAG